MRITATEVNNSGVKLEFDWLPTEIKDDGGNTTFASYTLLDRGELVRPSGNGLRRISWETMFPGEARQTMDALAAPWVDPAEYDAVLKRWRKDGARVKLTIEETDISSFTCYLSNYTSTYSGGFGDLQYSIEWTEFKSITVKTKAKVPPPKRPAKTYKSYVIKRGDTLWAIALKYLGDGNKYPKIYKLNKSVMDAEARKHGFKSANGGDNLWPGTKLKLPKK